ncbi:uncharacterized protein LOC103308371 [Acyrthosiphon pisum]|uniref:Integrase catalytic domain-containing protein n=1 Tax=Acyrthosiphon pisum TaxID=7029 RepID=A0A8R1WYV4_ACYPI|nr:uncharacterized protein LOC103308371 [Acyrthosiphon pisum]|eukprot:XP_008179837.1 PREDICTED: uncharacterized protein LOC103308371 [Acyrthosiphon pisum]
MELTNLSRQQNVRTNSQLAGLNPFIDEKGILRVGGRLKHSELGYNMKHPIILPKNQSFTTMIINQVHLHNLHSSLSVTMTLFGQRYWIIHNRSSVKKVLHNCIKCYRFRKATCHQLMSNLPTSRITPATAFERVGVDFAGPSNVKSILRCPTFTKSFLALFICLTTKAVHLEKVDGLSTEDFIPTLRRFIARRGHPSIISSDNGTNFTGTNNKLCELYKLVQKPDHQNSVTLFCQSKEIQWKFIPPASPYHGGLWESNIKSAKGILNKVTGDMCFTAEELNTLFCQIEAILNSRPLQAVSMDTTDYSDLTPGHFLIGICQAALSTGRPLLALPEPELTEVPMNRLTRWNLIQQLQQGFWKRWTSVYLCTLQNRPTWRFTQPNLQVGNLVIVKGIQTSPTQWPLARITQLLPSKSDGQVRVVKLRTTAAVLTRPITKLIKLPIDQ